MPPSKKTQNNAAAVNQQLLPRLRTMGWILCFCGIVSLLYAFLGPTYLPEIQPLEVEFAEAGPLLAPYEQLNFHAIAAIFVAVGSLCFIISKRKKV